MRNEGGVMLTYVNVDKNMNLVYDAPERVYPKSEILLKFESFVSSEGFSVEWENTKRVPYVAKLSKAGKSYTLVMYLKNITGAGWANKPHMKRVQVSNVRNDDMNKYIDTTNSQTILILGYYEFDNNPLFVAWNAYRYVYHNTVRSCYVSIDNLLDAYKSGFSVTECSDQEIWVFKPNHFEEFLQDYIEQNKIGD